MFLAKVLGPALAGLLIGNATSVLTIKTKDIWPYHNIAKMHPFYYRLIREGELPSKNIEDKRCDNQNAWICNVMH